MSRQDLKAYLDGELTADERLEVEKTLADNPEAKREFDQMQAVSRAMKQVKVPETTGFEATLFALSKAPRTPWYVRKPAWAYGAAAACIAVIAFLSVPVTQQERSQFITAGYSRGDTPFVLGGKNDTSVRDQGQAVAESSSAQASAPTAMLEDQAGARLKKSSPEAGEGLSYKDKAPAVGGQYIDQTGSVSIRVDSVRSASDQITAQVKKMGGFVANSTEGTSPGDGQEVANSALTIKVPSNHFANLVAEAKSLGELIQASTSSTDLTTEVLDTDARIGVLKQEEQQYLQILKQARTVKETLEVTKQLSAVRQDLESMMATTKNLKARAAMSTLELNLSERSHGGKKTLSGNWAVDTKNEAIASAMLKLRKIGGILIYAGVYSPVWIPILFGGVIVWRRFRKGIL